MRTPIVLLHSLGTDARLWRHQAPVLRALGPVHTLESRGHGFAPWNGTASIPEWVSDLHRAIEPIGPVHLVGLSMGGMQAVAFAATYPDLVTSLTVADSFASLPGDAADARIAASEEVIRQHGMPAWADEYLSQTLTRSLPAADHAALRGAISMMSPSAYLASAEATFRGDISEFLPGVRCPTLALTGADDRKTPVSALQRIAEGITDARLAVIEDAGHLSCIENPDAFNRELTRFLLAWDAAERRESVNGAVR